MMTTSDILGKLNTGPIGRTVRGLFNRTAAMLSTAAAKAAPDAARPGEEARPPSALFHPDMTRSYGSSFDTQTAGQRAAFPWAWAAMSALAVGSSAYANVIGFGVMLPNQRVAAAIMALALQVFVSATGILLFRQRASKALTAMMVLFGITSMTFTCAGLSAGTKQYQANVNKPIFALEEAHKAEKTQAEASAKTETAAIARIENELSFLTQHSSPDALLNTETGYVRDQAQRRADLSDLLSRWKEFDFSNDLAGAKGTDAIWSVLQKKYAEMEALTAATEKLTKGADGQTILMPAYPVPEVTEANDAKAGANDATGLYEVFHPSPKAFIFWLIALCLDGGPLLAGLAMNPAGNRRPEDDEEEWDTNGSTPSPSGGPEAAHSSAEDWAARIRGVRIVSDDLTADPLAASGDGLITANVKARQFAEQGALENATRKRALEIFSEKAAIERSMASVGLKPETIEAQVEADFKRLQHRQEREMEVADGEHEIRAEDLLSQQALKKLQNKLSIAKEIASLQAELDNLGGRNDGGDERDTPYAGRETTYAR